MWLLRKSCRSRPYPRGRSVSARAARSRSTMISEGWAVGVVLQGFRQCREPGSIFGLEHAQLSDSGTPTLGTAAAIRRSTRADRDGRRSGYRRTPGTVARLALGVAHCVIAVRLPSCGHGCGFRYVTHCSEVAAGLAPVGHSLLFAVGAGPPHDRVRRARRLNLSHDLAG